MPSIIGDLVVKLAAELGNTQDFLQVLRDLRGGASQLEPALEEAAGAIDVLNVAAKDTKSSMDSASSGLAGVASASETTASATAGATAQFKDLQSQLAGLQGQLALYRDAAAEAAANTRQIQFEMAALRPPVQKANEDINAFTTRLKQWQSAQADLRTQLSSSVSIQDQFRASIRDTQAQITTQLSAINQARKAQQDWNVAMGQSAPAAVAVSSALGGISNAATATGTILGSLGTKISAVAQAATTTATPLGLLNNQLAGINANAAAAVPANTVQNIQQVGTAATSASQGIGFLSGAFSRLGQVIEQTLLYGLAFQALSGIENLIGDTAGAFTEAQAKITGATGLIGEDLAAYTEGLRGLISVSEQTATDVGKALGDIESAFHIGPGDQLTALTKNVLDLSKISGEATDTIVTGLIKVQKAFDLNPTEFESAMNRIITVSQDSHIKVSDLQTTLARFGGLFRDLNVPVEQAAQFLGRVSDSGLDLNRVMTGLQQAMQKLGKNGAGDLGDALVQLQDRIHNSATQADAFAISAKVFEEHAADMAGAIFQGKLRLDDLFASLDPLHAKLSEQAEAMKTLADAWQEFKNRVIASDVSVAATNAATGTVQAANIIFSALQSIQTQANTATQETTDYFARMAQGLAFLGQSINTFASAGAVEFTTWGSGVVNAIQPALEKLAQFQAPLIWIYDKARDILTLQQFAKPPAGTANTDTGTNTPLSFPFAGGSRTTANAATSAYSFLTGGAAAYQAAASAADQAKNAAALEKILTGNTKANQLPKDPEYAILQRLVQTFSRDLTGKNNKTILGLQLENLLEQMGMPTEQDLDNQWLNYWNEFVKIAQARFQPVPDEIYNAIAEIKTKQTLAGLDQASAEKLLGLPDPTVVRGQIQEIEAAFALLSSVSPFQAMSEEIARLTGGLINLGGTFSDGYIAKAFEALATTAVAKARSIGDAVSDVNILTMDWAKTLTQITTIDLGFARTILGLTTESQALQSVIVEVAAYNEILAAYNAGKVTANDLTNAEIDLLTKEKTAAALVGNAFSDVNQVQLDYLQTMKQIQSLNSEGALSFFGIKSEQDLDNALAKIEDAYNKVHQAATAGSAQNDLQAQLRDAILQASGGSLDIGNLGVTTSTTALADLEAQLTTAKDKMDAFRAAGKVATDEMVQNFQQLGEKVKAASLDLETSMKNLGVIPTDIANRAIQTLYDELAIVKAKFTTDSAEYVVAATSTYTQVTALLQKSGQAVPAQLTADLDNMKAKLTSTVQTINQAFQALGVQSTETAIARMKVLKDAFEQTQNDITATAFTKEQARVAYTTAYYQNAIQQGDDYDKLDKAMNDILAERVRLRLQDEGNQYRNLTNLVADLYHTLQNDIASGLTGLINETQSVSQAFEKMGQDVEAILIKYVINNLILTRSNLNAIQGGLLRLFGADPSGGGGSGSNGTSVGIPGAFQFLRPPSGGGGGGTGGGGFDESTGEFDTGGGGEDASGGLLSSLGSLSGILNIANLGVNIASGIVSGVQQAHANALLDKIEKSTRFTWVATGEADDAISKTSKTTSQKTASMLDFLNTTLTTYLQNMNIDLDTIAGRNANQINLSAVLDLTPVVEVLQLIGSLVGNLIGTEEEILAVLQSFGTGTDTGTGAATSGRAGSVATNAVANRGVSRNGIINAVTSTTQTTGTAAEQAAAAAAHAIAVEAGLGGLSTDQLLAQLGYYTSAQQSANTAAAASSVPITNGPTVGGGGTTLTAAEGYDVFGQSLDALAAATPTANYDVLSREDPNNLLSTIAFNIANPTMINAGFYNAALGNYLAKINLPQFSAGAHVSDAMGLPVTGINAAVLNSTFGLRMTDTDFQTLIEPPANAILQGILNNYFPAGTDFSNLSADQLGLIQSQFDIQFPAALNSIISSISTTHPNLVDPNSPARRTNQYSTTPTGGSPQAQRTYSTAPTPVVGTYQGGISAAAAITAAAQALATPTPTTHAASTIDPDSYTGRYLASQQPGYAATLPKSTVSGLGTAIDYNSLTGIQGNPNAYSYANAINPSRSTPSVVYIQGNQFPVGMTPAQVSSALVDQMMAAGIGR